MAPDPFRPIDRLFQVGWWAVNTVREYPDRPWVGVGVVVWQGDKVLLVQRGRPPRFGQWGLPGGALHLGETLYDCAAREVLEETGLVVTPYAVVTALDAIHRDHQHRVEYHYALIEVAAECRSGEPVAADDVLEARWVGLDEVERLVEWDQTLRVIFACAEQRLRGDLPMLSHGDLAMN